MAADPAHHQVGIESGGVGVTEGPARRPFTNGVHDWLEGVARCGQGVVECSPTGVGMTLDDAGLFEASEPLGQYGARDARQAALQFVEVADAEEQLADDDQGPAFAEYFGAFGDRAVLAVSLDEFTLWGRCSGWSGRQRRSVEVVRLTVWRVPHVRYSRLGSAGTEIGLSRSGGSVA